MPAKLPNFTLKTRVGDFNVQFGDELEDEPGIFKSIITLVDRPIYERRVRDELQAYCARHEPPAHKVAAAALIVLTAVRMAAEVFGTLQPLNTNELRPMLTGLENHIDHCIHAGFKDIGEGTNLPVLAFF